MYGANLGVNQSDHFGEMAMAGRGGDTMMAHATPGETMIPPQIMANNPKLAAAVRKAFLAHGVNPDEFVAGSPLQKINPVTGQPEFGLFFGKGGIFGGHGGFLGHPITRTVAQVAASFVPVVGPALSAGIGALAGATGAGQPGSGSFGSALMGGLSGYGIGAGTQALSGAIGAGMAAPSGQGLSTFGSTLMGSTKAALGLGSPAPAPSNILWNTAGVPSSAGAINWAPFGQSITGGAGSSWLGSSGILDLLKGAGSAASSLGPLAAALAPRPGQMAPSPAQAAANQGGAWSPPAALPTAAATVPQGAGPLPYSPAAPTAGVSYMDAIKNRNTGQMDYTQSPFNSSMSSARRGSWGTSIFA